MTVYIIGIGMGGTQTLTQEAAAAIAASPLLIGARRMLAPYTAAGKKCVIEYAPAQIASLLRESDAAQAAVLFSGDTGFFSGAKKLLPLLDGMDVKCLPGISSMSYVCAKLGISYESMQFVTLHGRTNAIALPVKRHERCGFLLGGEMTAAQVCQRLCDYGLPDVRVYVGTNLGYPTEQVISGTAAELTCCTSDTLSVLIAENPEPLRYLPSCIADAAFVRGNVPMTKAVVRGTVAAVLQIERDSLCWDIGCGTGSVSVELAYRCPQGSVLAFDKLAEAVLLTQENARRFGCDNITAAEGTCPDCLRDAPAPDRVFIGGSTGKLRELFACIYARNPSAHIAVTAVSLETLHEAAEAFAAYGTACEIMQIAVTPTRTIGHHTMLQALNPVFLLYGRLL